MLSVPIKLIMLISATLSVVRLSVVASNVSILGKHCRLLIAFYSKILNFNLGDAKIKPLQLRCTKLKKNDGGQFNLMQFQ